MSKLLTTLTSTVDTVAHAAEPAVLQASEMAVTLGSTGFVCAAGQSFGYVSGVAAVLGCWACGIGSFAVNVAVFTLC